MPLTIEQNKTFLRNAQPLNLLCDVIAEPPLSVPDLLSQFIGQVPQVLECRRVFCVIVHVELQPDPENGEVGLRQFGEEHPLKDLGRRVPGWGVG